ncbi:MAG: protein kinase [Candidatus Riflebacteria bacterium]|nr:protein kinase [Candidatus Riflebacteria bacterium]
MSNGKVLCPTCAQPEEMLAGPAGDWTCPVCQSRLQTRLRTPASTPERPTEPGAGAPTLLSEPHLAPDGDPSLPFSDAFLNQYRFGRLLGKGGMGAVYLFHQVRLERPVAVKVVRGDDISVDQIRRLLKEARVLAGLNHPNIVAIHDADMDGSVPYIVCEYVDGESLARRLARPPPFELRQVLELMIPILDAVKTAHDKGVVHRDLKPDNVFLTKDGRPKIGDFGLAKADFVPTSMSGGRILGTPAYMSPEQCRGQGTTPSSDLYALGVILFEMAAGRRPFTGPDLADFIHQHAHVRPPSLGSVCPGVPAALSDIVDRALEKDPARRFPGAPEFQTALLDLYWGGSLPGPPGPHGAAGGADGAAAVGLKWLDSGRDATSPIRGAPAGDSPDPRARQATRSDASRSPTPAIAGGAAARRPGAAPGMWAAAAVLALIAIAAVMTAPDAGQLDSPRPAPSATGLAVVAPAGSPRHSSTPKPEASRRQAPPASAPASPSGPLEPTLSPQARTLRDRAMARGDRSYREGEWRAALGAYREAQEIDPRNGAVWRKLGLCRARLGQLDLALSALKRAAALAPTNPVVLNTCAVVLLKAGHPEDALGMARKAIALRPDDAEFWDTLGQALLALGRSGEARKAFTRALAIDPQHPEARQGLSSIGR